MIHRSLSLARLVAMSVVALMVAVLVAAPTNIATLAVAGRTNANVSLAAEGALVAAAWSASQPTGSTDIYAAVSRDGGTMFSSPVRVNSTPGDARVNGEQPPRVVLVPRAGQSSAIVVVWTSKSAVGTTILSARSEDGGKTFGKSAVIPGGEAAGNRGWENVAVDGQGNVRVLWLDHREMAVVASDRGATEHNHAGHDSSPAAKRDGVAMAQQSKLYVATLGDTGSTRVLLGGVCYCCKTAIVTSRDGDICAAWRHVYTGNVRDIAFTLSRDRGRTFAPPLRVSEDKWQLDGCPEDGPALAVDGRNQIHVVWPTLVNDGPDGRPSIGLFYAKSRDGRAFTARERLVTEGVPHHPQLTLAGESLVAAWDELKNGKRQAVVARRPLSTSPNTPFTRIIVSGSEPGIYPAVASSSKGTIVAWSTGANSVVRVAALQ